ncbi:MAG: hypothetical protein AAF591_18535 [Verrucomicrobiota bacterium]
MSLRPENTDIEESADIGVTRGVVGKIEDRVMKHTSPFVTINKLGEYCTSPSAGRRRTIVKDLKYGNPPKMQRYHAAYEAIGNFVAGGCSDSSLVEGSIAELEKKSGLSEWADNDRANTILALQNFLTISPRLKISGKNVEVRKKYPARIRVGSVDVSVRPEFLLRFDSRGRSKVGAIKLVFSKTRPLTDEWAAYIGTGLRLYLADRFATTATPDIASCLVVDVLAGEVFAGPKSITKRTEDLKSSCSEIALWWRHL